MFLSFYQYLCGESIDIESVNSLLVSTAPHTGAEQVRVFPNILDQLLLLLRHQLHPVAVPYQQKVRSISSHTNIVIRQSDF